MPVSNFNIQVIICTILCIICFSTAVWADNQTNLRQKLFETDKTAALANFDSAQKQSCVKAFNSRYQSEYTLSNELAFNELLSLAAYDTLFWKGGGSSQRGLLFTAAVNNKSGVKAGNLVCYYAMTDHHMDFQSAYVMPLPTEKSVVASSANANNIHPSLINYSSKE